MTIAVKELALLEELTAAASSEGERHVPSTRPYNAAMHLGHTASYREALRYSYGRRVLDLGCGVGYGAFWLASYGADRVAAVDLSPPALRYARHVYPHPRVHYLQADAVHLPFANETFDFVFSSQVIEHVPSVDEFMREVRRLLTPAGFCLFTTPNQRIFSPRGASSNPHHVSEMTWSEYQQAARAIFPATRFQGIPQRCLTSSDPTGAPSTKPNAEIRPENYRVQDTRLEECENMLCFGHNSARGQFTVSLPARLLAAANELAPIFWDASRRWWSVLGVYPGARVQAPLELSSGDRLTQIFRSPYSGLYRVEVDLVRPGPSPIRLALSHNAVTVAETIVAPDAKVAELRMQPRLDSQDQPYVLTLELTLAKRQWPQPLDAVHVEAADGQAVLAECCLNGQSIHQQIAMRTFHAVLPEPEEA